MYHDAAGQIACVVPRQLHKGLVYYCNLKEDINIHLYEQSHTAKQGGCFKPIVHFWLHHIAHWPAGSASPERVGQREVGGVTHTVTCTWWMLGLTLKRPWSVQGGPTPRPDCMDRLRKHYSHLVEDWFLARKAAWALSGCMATDSADYCMLVMSGFVQSHETACLLRPEVDMGAVLESEL